jgi:hypothetical protein
MSSPATQVDLEFGDGVYTFKLGLVQISELQTKCGCGIGALYARVLRGRYMVGDQPIGNVLEAEFFAVDLIETIRLGLMGGKRGEVSGEEVEVKPADANRLVAAYVFPERPLTEAWGLAAAILATAIEGYAAPDKKKEGEGEPVTDV